MSYPDARGATVEAMDDFMASIGITYASDEVRRVGTGNEVLRLRNYNLDLGSTSSREPGPRVLIFVAEYPATEAYFPPQIAWMTELWDELGASYRLPYETPRNRGAQLLDYVAGQVTALGYPRASTGLTALLYATHIQQLDIEAHIGRMPEEAMRQYAYLANETRLSIQQRYIVAERGMPLAGFKEHVDNNVPFNLLCDFLSSKMWRRYNEAPEPAARP